MFFLLENSLHKDLLFGQFFICLLLNLALLVVRFTARLLVLLLVVILVKRSVLWLDWSWWLEHHIDLHHLDKQIRQGVVTHILNQSVESLTLGMQQNVSKSRLSLLQKKVSNDAKEISARNWQKFWGMSKCLSLLPKFDVGGTRHKVDCTSGRPAHVIPGSVEVQSLLSSFDLLLVHVDSDEAEQGVEKFIGYLLLLGKSLLPLLLLLLFLQACHVDIYLDFNGTLISLDYGMVLISLNFVRFQLLLIFFLDIAVIVLLQILDLLRSYLLVTLSWLLGLEAIRISLIPLEVVIILLYLVLLLLLLGLRDVLWLLHVHVQEHV